MPSLAPEPTGGSGGPGGDGLSGPMAVGLYALQNREFFQALLMDPREALTSGSHAARFGLTDPEREVLITLIQQQSRTLSPSDFIRKWEKYRENGIWGGGWMMTWPCR